LIARFSPPLTFHAVVFNEIGLLFYFSHPDIGMSSYRLRDGNNNANICPMAGLSAPIKPADCVGFKALDGPCRNTSVALDKIAPAALLLRARIVGAGGKARAAGNFPLLPARTQSHCQFQLKRSNRFTTLRLFPLIPSDMIGHNADTPPWQARWHKKASASGKLNQNLSQRYQITLQY